jgi:hypothetical protein
MQSENLAFAVAVAAVVFVEPVGFVELVDFEAFVAVPDHD